MAQYLLIFLMIELKLKTLLLELQIPFIDPGVLPCELLMLLFQVRLVNEHVAEDQVYPLFVLL
jgi:hypothetical protein